MLNDSVPRLTTDAAHETAGRLAAILETAVDGIITIDDHGTIETVNPATLKIFGYEAHELIGQNVRVLMPEPYRGEHDTYLANYRRTGERKIIGVGRKVAGRRKDGSTFPLELAVSETRLGERRFFTGIVRDVTERERAEAALRASEATLRAIVEAAVDGIITIDETGRIASFNRAAERLFGYAAAEVLGANVTVLMPEPYRGEHDDYLRNYLTTGRAKIIGIGREVRGRHKDGSTFPMELAVGEGHVDRRRIFAGTVRDITERKRAEEQRELLLAELSHRVKNILAVVQTLAERTGGGTPSVAAFLGAFEGRLHALAAAHNLLTEGGWRSASLLELARVTLAPYLGQDGRVRLEVKDLALRPRVAQTFALVFHELTTNAGKYGALSVPGGRIVLMAQPAPGHDGEELRVEWREEGGPAVRRPQKTGFGTTLLAQAIEYQHEGRVELDWREEGLVCRFSLPLAEAEAADSDG